MKKSYLKILAAVAAFGLTSAANAAFVVLGGASSATENFSAVLAPGASTTVYLWADATGSNAATFVNSLSFRVESTGQALTGSAFTWDAAATGFAGTQGASVAAGAATAFGTTQQLVGNTNGTAAADTGINAANALRRIGSFTLTVPADATPGAVSSIYLVVGANRITESPTASNTGNLAIGYGGVGVSGQYSGVDNSGFTTTGTVVPTIALQTNAAGTRSSLADASITVLVPEPTSLALLGLGALGLASRRRKA